MRGGGEIEVAVRLKGILAVDPQIKVDKESNFPDCEKPIVKFPLEMVVKGEKLKEGMAIYEDRYIS